MNPLNVFKQCTVKQLWCFLLGAWLLLPFITFAYVKIVTVIESALLLEGPSIIFFAPLLLAYLFWIPCFYFTICLIKKSEGAVSKASAWFALFVQALSLYGYFYCLMFISLALAIEKSGRYP